MGGPKVKKTKNGQWYWDVIGGNNETLCHSEMYASKQMAKKGLNSARKNILLPAKEESNALGD